MKQTGRLHRHLCHMQVIIITHYMETHFELIATLDDLMILKIWWLVLEILRKILKSGFSSRCRMVICISQKYIRCTTRCKGPHVCELWWLKVLWFLRFARAKGSPETWRNNNKKDSIENNKTTKDSKVIWNHLITIDSCKHTIEVHTFLIWHD